jgi:hypothetical protein
MTTEQLLCEDWLIWEALFCSEKGTWLRWVLNLSSALLFSVRSSL